MTELFNVCTATWYAAFFVCFILLFFGIAGLMLCQSVKEYFGLVLKSKWFRAKYLGEVFCNHEWPNWACRDSGDKGMGYGLDNDGDLAAFEEADLQRRQCTQCGLTQEKLLYANHTD